MTIFKAVTGISKLAQLRARQTFPHHPRHCTVNILTIVVKASSGRSFFFQTKSMIEMNDKRLETLIKEEQSEINKTSSSQNGWTFWKILFLVGLMVMRSLTHRSPILPSLPQHPGTHLHPASAYHRSGIEEGSKKTYTWWRWRRYHHLKLVITRQCAREARMKNRNF